MSDNPAQQRPPTNTDSDTNTDIDETLTTIAPDPTSSDDSITTISTPSSDTSSHYTGSSTPTTSAEMGSLPTLGMPPKNVTITIPFAAIVVPPVLVVAAILAFFGWRYWKRKRMARKLDEEKVAPFLTAEPQPGKEVFAAAAAAAATATTSNGYRNEKSLGTLNRLGDEKGERDESVTPLLQSPLAVPSSSSGASSSGSSSSTTPFTSRPSGSTRDEKVARWRSDSPTPTPSAHAFSAVGYLGAWPADQAVPREGDAAFAQYSQALNIAMQRAGFSPQALLESLNRVPVDDVNVDEADADARSSAAHMHSQRPPAYNG